MEILSRIMLQKLVVPDADSQQGRLAWLAGFYRLGPLEVEIVVMLAGLRGVERPEGWPLLGLAERLSLDEDTLVDCLAPTAPLVKYGLVRLVPLGVRVRLNDRIARFLAK